jgi:hypothetical protein
VKLAASSREGGKQGAQLAKVAEGQREYNPDRRLSNDETAEARDVSPDSVMRDWKMAKLWLLRELKREAKQQAAGGE